MIRRMLVAAVAVFAFGCVSSQFRSLPEQERATFFRCEKATRGAQNFGAGANGPIDDAVYGSTWANEFAKQPTPSARRTWLVANGCPPHMVEPERYVSADPAPRPARAHRAADEEEPK